MKNRLLRLIVLLFASVVASPSSVSRAQEKEHPPFVLTDFITSARGNWAQKRKGFLEQVAFLQAKAKEINSDYSPYKLPDDLQPIDLVEDDVKSRQMIGKLIFATNRRRIPLAAKSVVVCKDDLIVNNGAIQDTVLLIDGNLTLKGISTISNSCVFVTKSCLGTRLLISHSVVFCLGTVVAETIGNSFIFSDMPIATLLVHHTQFAGGGVVRERDKLDKVTLLAASPTTDWFRFYSAREFPFRLVNQKGKFFIDELQPASRYAKNGLKGGDQILKIGALSQFETSVDILGPLKDAGAGRVEIQVLRDGKTLDLTIGQ